MTNQPQQTLREKLKTYDGPDKVVTAKEILDHIRTKPQVRMLKSGLANLDKSLGGGFHPGDLVVLSGATGMGKTTLSQTFEVNMLKTQAIASLLLSYEGRKQELLEKFENFDPSVLKCITMPRQTEKHHLQWIEERIIESFEKYGTRTVVIDHLHRLVYKGKGTNFTEEIGNTVIPLKEMAVRLEMVIFLICHISQEATKKLTNGEELGLGAVRDSSFIEQEADVVLYTWRMRDDKNKNVPNANIMKLVKNRHNGEIDVSFPLRFKKGLYYEMARDEYENLISPRKDPPHNRKSARKDDSDFVHEELGGLYAA